MTPRPGDEDDQRPLIDAGAEPEHLVAPLAR